MSTGSQHKMYNYEVAPPPGVWEKIAAELDESELSKKFPSRLYNIEIAPPARAWQHIATALDEPALVNEYAGKLSGIAIAPPAGVWNKIKNTLDSEEEVITRRRTIFPLLKYAAAAAVLAFLAWGGLRLLKDNKTGDTTIAKQDLAHPTHESENTGTNTNGADENTEITEAAINDEARNDAALEASKKTYARLDTRSKESKIKNAADFLFIAENYEPPGDVRGLGIIGVEPEPYRPADLTNRYVMLMTPDGKIIRVSKKLGNLVCCVSGEEQDKDCIDQMKKWRDKIANPSATHSPGNFMDILSMVSSLQDNN